MFTARCLMFGVWCLMFDFDIQYCDQSLILILDVRYFILIFEKLDAHSSTLVLALNYSSNSRSYVNISQMFPTPLYPPHLRVARLQVMITECSGAATFFILFVLVALFTSRMSQSIIVCYLFNPLLSCTISTSNRISTSLLFSSFIFNVENVENDRSEWFSLTVQSLFPTGSWCCVWGFGATLPFDTDCQATGLASFLSYKPSSESIAPLYAVGSTLPVWFFQPWT